MLTMMKMRHAAYTLVTLFGTMGLTQLLGQTKLPTLASLPDKEGTFVLAGSVTNSVTGAAIGRASVTLNSFGVDFAKSAVAFTDAAGNFHFDKLPAATYQVTPRKPLFDWGVGETVNLTQTKNDVSLRLVPYGSIEGKAVDSDGEPLQGVSIQLLATDIEDGMRTVSLSRSVSTDDLGRYRFWNLRPGKYYLKAAGRSGGTRLFLGERTPSFDSHECFTPVYSTGAATLPAAQPVVLGAGAGIRADFSLPMRPAYKIRGVVSNFEPYLTARFELLMGGEDVAANRVALNSATGKFEIQDVVPGPYVLRVTQGAEGHRKRAELSITVSDAPIDSVNMPLSAGTDIEGHAQFPVAAAAEPEPGRRVQNACRALIRSADLVPHSPGSREIPETVFSPSSPTFTFKNVLPGNYNVEFSCAQAYVVSALAGSQNLLVTHVLEVRAGAAPLNLDLEVRGESGSLSASTKTRTPASLIKVVLVPQFATGVVSVQQFSNGSFQSGPLAPGDYLVYAFPQEQEVEFRNPVTVRSWQGGVPAHIDAKQVTTIELPPVAQ